MGGRLSGIFIAKYLKPRTMVTTSLVCCIGAALLLVIVGGYSKIGVYVGTCKYTRCLKITEKVSFNIASEASYLYILSGQKLIKNGKDGPFWRVFGNLKLAVK